MAFCLGGKLNKNLKEVGRLVIIFLRIELWLPDLPELHFLLFPFQSYLALIKSAIFSVLENNYFWVELIFVIFGGWKWDYLIIEVGWIKWFELLVND